MGTGKSAAAEKLAARLGKKLVAVDSVIAREAGKTIPCIFEDEGEIGFRQREIEAIKRISLGRKQVVDCGGGVVLNRINIDRLKQDCVIVWLTASIDAILKRTQREAGTRPVLDSIQSRQELEELLRFRRPYYERASEMKINTARLNLEKVVNLIVDELKNHADYCP
jgi:shikimate kinase